MSIQFIKDIEMSIRLVLAEETDFWEGVVSGEEPLRPGLGLDEAIEATIQSLDRAFDDLQSEAKLRDIPAFRLLRKK